MKILTVNFLTCAVKTCKTSPDSFPLHFRDAELERSEVAYNPAFVRNILPRVDWEALRVTAVELGFSTLPATKPEFASPDPPSTDEVAAASSPETSSDAEGEDVPMPSADAAAADQKENEGETKGEDEQQQELLKELHVLLLETEVREGKMVCGHCGHEYRIKEGIANFLLPSHLGMNRPSRIYPSCFISCLLASAALWRFSRERGKGCSHAETEDIKTLTPALFWGNICSMNKI